MPKFYDYDAAVGVLVLEFINEAQDFREYHLQRGHFSLILAKALGAALGHLHSPAYYEASNGSPTRQLLSSAPWALSSFYPPTLHFYQTSSSAGVRLMSVMQQFPALGDLLRELADEWTATVLIHGDMRWDNCLACNAVGAHRKTRVRIIDWELAAPGDPCWDVGCVLCDHLWLWLNSIPDSGGEVSERLLGHAGYPLEAMHPAISTFWASYASTMGLSDRDVHSWSLLATRYAAARMIQLAYEYMQAAPSLTATAVAALQLSLNILKRPAEARAILLGLGSP